MEPQGPFEMERHKSKGAAARRSRRDGLSPTARRIVVAARRLLMRGGYESLTLRAINKEAGISNDAAIGYYFGSKARLVEVVLAEVTDEYCGSFSKVTPGMSTEQRVDAFLNELREWHKNPNNLRSFFNAFPHVVQDHELHAALADAYASWYERSLEALFPDAPSDEPGVDDSRYLTRVIAAMADGLAVQGLIHGREADLEPVLAAMKQVLLAILASNRVCIGGKPHPLR